MKLELDLPDTFKISATTASFSTCTTIKWISRSLKGFCMWWLCVYSNTYQTPTRKHIKVTSPRFSVSLQLYQWQIKCVYSRLGIFLLKSRECGLHILQWKLIISHGRCVWVTRVGKPTSVTYLIRTPIFQWWVARCRPKSRHEDDICWQKRFDDVLKNMLTILGSIVIVLGGTNVALLMAHCQ